MPALTTTLAASFSDKITAGHLALKGSSGTNTGAGDSSVILSSDYGFSKAMRDMQALVAGSADADIEYAALTPAKEEVALAGWEALDAAALAIGLQMLNTLAKSAGLATPDFRTFCAYYNTGAGGPYSLLQHPSFAEIWNQEYPGNPMDAASVYPHAIANMAQQVVAGAFTAGTAVDSTHYAGAAIAQAVITGFTGTSGTLTVIGSARNAAGAVVTNRTFTATISANGTVTLAPNVAGDLLVSVSTITPSVNQSAGTIVISCAIPTGRVDPPTP